MIRTALIALTLTLVAPIAAQAAQPEDQQVTAEASQQKCHPIFVTCPAGANSPARLSLLDEDFLPVLRDKTEAATA
ncbi:MAG: hypothetical protein KIT02_10580 [Devosia sp.]|uniref:hypothetical protein n=1 Tax=Devosia sp. TaxID=1871048 RepID=UPI0024C7AF09|nr:hypothetical protein [Devosia sp.]UYN98403.1 MAG: hypothetical protein KIT02_10580 [Devosia sp.]